MRFILAFLLAFVLASHLAVVPGPAAVAAPGPAITAWLETDCCDYCAGVPCAMRRDERGGGPLAESTPPTTARP